MNGPDLQWNYNILLQGNFFFGGFTPEPPLGDAAPKPLLGARLPPDPTVGGMVPPYPTEGVPPLFTPPRRRVYILLGCKYFMGYKHGRKQGPLHQGDNQAPQPIISHLETDLNNSTAAVYAGIWTFLDLANFSSSSSILKTNWNWARTQFLSGYSLC